MPHLFGGEKGQDALNFPLPVQLVLTVTLLYFFLNNITASNCACQLSPKQTPPVSDHFVITILFLSQILFQELPHRRPLLKFLGQKCVIFLMLSVPGKRPPQIITQRSQKFGFYFYFVSLNIFIG